MSYYGLIQELRLTKEPSRELDRRIWLSREGNTIKVIREVGGHVHERWFDAEGVWWRKEMTDFTASLDSALLLFEERPARCSTNPIEVCIAWIKRTKP